MKYVDTHCHLLNEYFDNKKISLLIQEAQQGGVDHIVVPATTWQNSQEVIKLAQEFKQVYGAIGIHPSETAHFFDNSWLKAVSLKKIIAIGEIGLDFYWENNPPLATQVNIFEIFLDFALAKNLPALIHMRNSEVETYNILSKPKYKNLKFVIHSFTSTYEWACKFIDLGGYISFSGIVTFKNAKDLQMIVQKLPLNRLLSETDTPFLTPTPHRGQQNKPLYVSNVVNFIAKLRSEDQDHVVKIIYQNAQDFFQFTNFDHNY